MPFVRLRDVKFHYQQAGSGSDVVLIHGVTGDLSLWFLSRTLQVLSQDHRVTAYDLRGHGYSEAPPEGYTSADHAEDLLALMDQLGIERATLVGHSFGGVIAAHLATMAPERTHALVLSDPYFPSLRHLEDVSRWGHWQNFRQEAEDAGVLLSDEHWYDIGRFFDQVLHLDGEELRKFRQAVGLPSLNRLLRLGRTTCGHDSKQPAGLTPILINSICVPVLALYGEQSPFLATAHYLASHLPECRVSLVPGAKHRAPEEAADAFVAILAQFCRQVHEAESTTV
ncbi:MAG: alpha/beta hydrolase [Isosphaeraceae bacterium]